MGGMAGMAWSRGAAWRGFIPLARISIETGCAWLGDSWRFVFCDISYNPLLGSGIFKRLCLTCARFARKSAGFNADDFLRYPVDFGRWLARSVCRGGTWRAKWIVAHHMGYAQYFHDR